MKIRYYRTTRGDQPVEQYILSLPARDQAAVEAVFRLLAEYGLGAPGVQSRHVQGKLWEIKIGAHRIFYVVIVGPEVVLLHAYRKQTTRAPVTEIELARRRMAEVLQ